MAASLWFHRRYNREVSETNIWDRDWDLLVVLDACRVDWMETVETEYPFINDVNTIWSVGSHSEEWLENTFENDTNQALDRTAYISANHFASAHIEEDSLAVFEDVNKYLGSDDDYVVPPAHLVTDRAIDIARSGSFNRIVVHYMQPHKPFFEKKGNRRDVNPVEWSMGRDLYKNYFRSEITKKQLWNGFVDNLRYTLDEVSILLENVDADTAVLSADHGQALGERFLWDHRPGVRHPHVRKVPWVETSASDLEKIEPASYNKSGDNQHSVEKRLAHLGYK